MEITNGKITKCTNSELYEYWLKQWSDFMSYDDYKAVCIELGTTVEEDTNE